MFVSPGNQKLVAKRNPHRNGTPDEREALREYLKTNGCGSLADCGEQVTERRLTLSPRNGSVKNWVYLQKVVVSFQIFHFAF